MICELLHMKQGMDTYLCFSNRSDESLCPAETGYSTDLDFRLTKDSAFASIDRVAHHGKLASSS